MIRYAVVQAETLNDCINKTNQYIEMGWIPQGGAIPFRPRVSGPEFWYQSVYNPEPNGKMAPDKRGKGGDNSKV